jgi:hypothetical protein
MPLKRARVSAECAIANIMHFMRFMEQYDDGEIRQSVMLKMIWIVYMGRAQFQLYIFSYGTEMPACKEKIVVFMDI